MSIRNGKYIFHKEDLEKLVLKDENLKERTIVCVSIARALRKGRSFMLGVCLRYLIARYVKKNVSNWLGDENDGLTKGFVWRNGMMHRTTTGIDVWDGMLLYDAPSGEKLAILLVDTQGGFDHKTTATENSTIFAVSTLMSSVQIFNLMSNIQEDDLQNLQQFAALGSVAVERTHTKPFQSLIFLVRDWPGEEEAPCGLVGGCRVLENVFDGERSQDMQRTRKNTKAAFNDIRSYLMPHPGKLATKEDFKGELKLVDSDFRQHLEVFIRQVLVPENLIRKVYFGRETRARDFILNIKTNVDLFNSDEAPKPESVFEANVKSNNTSAVISCFKRYTTLVRSPEVDCLAVSEFAKQEESIRQTVFAEFDDQTKYGGETLASEYRTQLSQQDQDAYQVIFEGKVQVSCINAVRSNL